MTDTRLEAALEGNLEHYMADELAIAKEAVTHGIQDTAGVLKGALRQDVIRGGLGRRLSRSWQSDNYPRSGASLGAASVVYTKAQKLIRAFDEGATIRSDDGFFLAIPSEAAPKTGMGRKRLTPSNFPEHYYGPLRFVYRRNGASLLVVDNLRARGGKRAGTFAPASKRARRTGDGLTTVVMFYLVPQTRLRRRLNVGSIAAAVTGDVARNIDVAFQGATRRRLR